MNTLLEKAKNTPRSLSAGELKELLVSCEPEALFRAAYEVKLRTIGKRVSLRGLIEMGNLCSKDCLDCGIRKSNRNTTRFQLDEDAVVRMAKWAFDAHYGSIAIQSGEIESEKHTVMIENILHRIRDLSNGQLGVTLSLGEQTEDVFRRWREAGARRYLLRIEESDPVLYAKLHPAGHDFARRSACLDLLRKLDYQVG
ncbi:MAG: [FeFe] hydrogenase H-cluster radical SAM maturase HydE, partial [Lentisphaeria bacterium]|nr:[FeFe] hydrogenase H-cluster radical SAM maturase HydE [Lentisphaeria bacterium]